MAHGSLSLVSVFIIVGLVVTLVYGFSAARMDGVRITQPVALIATGAVAAALFAPDLGTHLNTQLTERVVEIVLALLLFADATEVRGRIFGTQARLSARLVLIALPLSVLGAVLFGAFLFPSLSLTVLLVLACVVLPTDLAAASLILKDARIPERLRHTLNIESGYNDAVVSPVFMIALAVAAGEQAPAGTPFGLLEGAILPFLVAVIVGLALGALSGLALRWAISRQATVAASARIGVVVLPFLTYAAATAFHGNGFVAAFIAGLAFRAMRTRTPFGDGHLPHAEISAVEDIGRFASAAVWFVLGGVLYLTIITGPSWEAIVYALLALTLFRMLPVALALTRTPTTKSERTVLGVLGPRGPASIVFGLLAYNVLRDDQADLVLSVTVLVVVGSALLHGIFAPGAAVAILRRSATAPARRRRGVASAD